MKRVRYISRVASSIGAPEINEIIRISQRNNPQRNVTGMLIAFGDLFYQLLEGPQDEIDALYAKIAKDPRHEQVLLIESETGNFDRICPDWAMQKVDLSLRSTAETAPVGALLEMICVQRMMEKKALQTLAEYTWENLLSNELHLD